MKPMKILLFVAFVAKFGGSAREIQLQPFSSMNYTYLVSRTSYQVDELRRLCLKLLRKIVD